MECEAADGTVSLYWLPAKFSKVGPAMDGTRTRAVFPSCPLAIAMRAERGRGQAGLAGERTRGSGEEGGTEIRVCVYYIQISIERERERGRERDTERYVCMCIIYICI